MPSAPEDDSLGDAHKDADLPDDTQPLQDDQARVPEHNDSKYMQIFSSQ